MSARGFGRSVGCVWMVSGRCVEGDREVLGSVWKVSGISSLGLKLSLAILELKEKMQESSGMKQTKQAG